jgi:D-3-phosphoglycerate dehydrogenase
MRILITSKKFHPSGHEVLSAQGAEIRTIDQYETRETLRKELAAFDPDGLISRTIDVGPDEMDLAPSLKVIAKTGVGFDNIDVAAATIRKIPVLVSFGTNARSVAELGLAHMFALARNIVRHNVRMHAGEWSRFAFPAHELFTKELGIVGFGQSAQHLARMTLGIGMRPSVWAPRYRYEQPPEGVRIAPSLDDLIANCDILSLNCQLNEQTRGMIDAAAIARMRPGAWIINIARGPLIDEAALIEALRSGQIGGAGLDTFETEPIAPDNPLLAFDNVTVTPHTGGTTLQSSQRSHPFAAKNILDVLLARPIEMRALVNPEVLQKS